MTTRDAVRIADRYDRAIEELERDAIERLNQSLDAVYRDLEKELRASYSDLQTQGGLVASQQKLLIEDQLGDLLRLSQPGQADEYEQIYTDLLQSTSLNGSTMADELVKAIDSQWPITQFSRIPLEAVALQARDGVRRLGRHSEDFASRASAIVEQGLIQGWGVARVADGMRRELGITKGKAETIARTETSSALNDAAQKRYKDNGLKHFQWFVTPSEGLCPFCTARNGKVYRLDKVRVPAHPRCRCMAIPWSKPWQEKGLTDDEFVEDFRDRNIAALRADGQKPNFGPTYWERKAGLTKAPKSVWTPGRSPVRKRRTTAAKPVAVGTFPDDPNQLTVVRQLGGSTGAELVQDAAGNQFVRKRGASEAHLREEFAADQAYRALGVAVPEGKLYETSGGPVKLSRFIDGQPLGRLSGKQREAAISAIQEHFAVDALLGNWDAVGQDLDNILIDATGKSWRIDNGGSFRFRAQGERKGNSWDGYPQEIWSLRDSAVNEQTASVFGSLGINKIAVQMSRIVKRRDSFIKSIPAELRPMINQRLDEYTNVVRTYRTLREDKFRNEYIDQFIRHGMGIRSAGITDRLPKFLAQAKQGGVTVVDPDGKKFDDLRGRNSIVSDLDRYITSVGGDYKLISQWMQAQAGDSWSSHPQAYKWYISSRRSNDAENDYWWRDGRGSGKQKLLRWMASSGVDLETFERTFQAFHAFNTELLRSVEFTNNNRDKGTVRVVRTESHAAMKLNGLNRGDRGVTMKRGPVESTSIFKRIEVYGTEITVQHVPHHRILGTYFQSRHPGGSSGAFMGNGENEFVAMLEGIPFDYEAEDIFTGTGDGPKPPKKQKKQPTLSESEKKIAAQLDDLLDPGSGDDDDDNESDPFGDVVDLDDLEALFN